jgi:hypothetical protein
MLRYLTSWIDQVCRQRLKPMEKLARMMLDRLQGILNDCRTKVPLSAPLKRPVVGRVRDIGVMMEGVSAAFFERLKAASGYEDANPWITFRKSFFGNSIARARQTSPGAPRHAASWRVYAGRHAPHDRRWRAT